MNALMWTCHVCGKLRPDERISVFSRAKTLAGGIQMQENVRYCNDNPDCETKAHDIHWVPA